MAAADDAEVMPMIITLSVWVDKSIFDKLNETLQIRQNAPFAFNSGSS